MWWPWVAGDPPDELLVFNPFEEAPVLVIVGVTGMFW